MPSDTYQAIIEALWQQERSRDTPVADQRAAYDAFGCAAWRVGPAVRRRRDAAGVEGPRL